MALDFVGGAKEAGQQPARRGRSRCFFWGPREIRNGPKAKMIAFFFFGGEARLKTLKVDRNGGSVPNMGLENYPTHKNPSCYLVLSTQDL